MINVFDGLRDLTVGSVLMRMLCALFCGGIIGIEREYKRRPAGFRTHILICIGAAMTTITSQYLLLCLGYYTDPARLGAQVVAGIGFIGAGTIIVTKQQRVKGLTTAAGLWVSAIVGLALGAGFFEGGILVTLLILLAELLLVRLEYGFLRDSRERIYYIEYSGEKSLEQILNVFRDHHAQVMDIEITKEQVQQNSGAIFQLRIGRKAENSGLETALAAVEGLCSVEEL